MVIPFFSSGRRRGFTLMELLIVIAIIGILISIAASSYTSAQKKSRDSRRIGDMKTIQNAYEQYYADNNASYPTDISQLTGGASPYLPAGVPIDPKLAPYEQYNHTFPSGGYCSCATLEGGGGNATNRTCAFGSGSYYCVKSLQ